MLNRGGTINLGSLTQRGAIAAKKGAAAKQMYSDIMVHNIDRETYHEIAHEFVCRKDIEYINMKLLERK